MGQERARSAESLRSPASGPWSAEVSRALRESLEGYCLPEIGMTIVQAALDRAGLAVPPETPRELSEFVRQHLSPAVEERLGGDAAAEVEQRIAMVIHVLGRASRAPVPPPDDVEEPKSEERRTLPVGADIALVEEEQAPITARPPGERDEAGAITLSTDSMRGLALGVVSPDAKLAGRVREILGDGGDAFGYRTVADLARAEPGALHVVLVDRRGSAPSSTPVLPDAIAGAQVVLWPARPETAGALQALSPHVASVTAYGAEVTVDDVVVLLRLAAHRRRSR